MGRLLKGKSSVAYRVEKIKEFLDKMKISNPSFEIPTFFREIKAEIQVADEHGVANVNVLKGFQFLKSARITKRTAVEKNAILRSFKDISHNGIKGFTEGQNETVKQLLDDYVQYVVVTSGFGYSDQSLLQSIPIEYLLEKGMGEFAKFADQNLFNDPSSSEGVLDQIIRHDFADSSMNRIVPEVTIGRKGGIDVVLPTYTNGTVTTFKVNPTVSSALYSERGYPKYTKMADSGGTLHLYKFKGYSDLESTIGNYEMEESLGIPNKFFEYQFGSNPKSIVPANKVLDFQPLEVLRTDKIETENSAQQLLGISKEEFSYYVKEVQKGNIPDSIKEKIKDVVLPTDDGKTQYTSAFRTWDLGKMAGTPETAESTKKLDDFIINHPDRSVDGGESFNTFRDRVLSEFQTQLEQAPDNATIVTHNSVLGLMKLWDKMGRPELGKGQQESKGINFQEDQTFGYRERTIKNASADATVAIAHDFNSAGERLTKGSVLAQKKLYLPVPTSSFSSESSINAYAGRIASELNKLPNNEISLNIAGNGIYTLKGTLTQGAADNFTFELLAKVIQRLNPEKHITSLRTGGQTGFDEAGAKAGLKLGIPTLILAPKGWKFRNISGQDISSEQKFKSRFPQAPESKNIDKEFVEAYVQQSTQTGEVAEFKSNNGTLFVARHGETEDNLKGNYRNDTTKLTSKGIEEAKQVGEKLKDKNISQIISSDLPRAKFTASLLRSKQDLNFKTKGFDTDKKLSNDVLSALKGLIAKANYGLNGLDIVDLQRKYNNDIVAVTNHTEKLVEFAANEEGLAALPEETTHVFSTFVRHTPMYTELKKLARDSQYYEDVISNPIYQQEFGNIKDNEEKYASEAADKLIADDIFRKGDSIMKESKSFWAKVKALINRMWEWFKGKARRNQDAVQAWKQQVSDITEKYARDILTGNISGEGVGSGLSMKVRAKTPLEFFLDKQIRFQEANIEKLESLIAKEISSGQTDPSRHEKTLENTRLFLTKLQEAVDAKGNVEQNKQFLMNMNKAERLLTELNNRVAEGNITKNQLNDAYSVTDAYIDANQALSPEVAGELKDKANSVSAKALELSLKLKDLVDNHVTELVNTLTTDPQFKESSYNSLDPVEDLSWVQTNLYPARNVPNTLIQITHKLGYKCVKNEEESFNALKLVILQSFDKLTAFKGTVDLVQLSEDFIQKDANGVPNGRFVDQKSDTFLKAIKDNYKRLKDESDEDYKKRIVLWKKNNLKTKSNYQEIKDNMKRILGEQGYRKWFFANHTMNEDDHGNVRYYVGVDLQESKDKIKYPDDAKWAKINSTSALKEFYNDYTGHWALGDTMGSAKYKMGNKLASLSAGIIELIRTNGIGPALRSVKNEIIEALSFKVKQEDSNDELQAEVPITFTPRKPKSGNLSDHKLKANLKSVDLKNGLLTYLQERHLEKALRQVKEDCELISRHIKNNRVIKTNLRGKNPTFEVGSKSNLDKRYDGLMHELMGTSKEPTVILKMNINKLMSLVMETTGIINLGFNYTAAAHRFALGTLMGGSEAYAGTYFNTKDFMKAGAMMMSKPYSHVLKTLMKEYEIAQFTKYFIKGNNERSVASSLAGKVFSRDVFYFFHSELEFYLQSRQVLAKLIHVQHDGKSFIDHLRVQNGVIVPKEGSSLTKDQMYNEIYKAKGLMTNIHGNSNEKSPFQLHTATGPIFQHKSWLPAGISNSWSDRHYEESLGDSTGGYSKTLYTFILGDIARINAFKHKLDFNDPSVRRDFSRAMFIWASRVGVALASMLVADYIKNSQDVEVPFTGGTTKNEILSATRYVMDKTVLDLEFFDPIGFWDAAYNTFLNPQKSPLPLLGFLKEATDLVQRAALEIRNLAFHDVPAKDLMYSKNEYGHHVGDRKIMTSVKKLLGPLSPDNRIKRVAEVENKKK
jgi:broad specificity phosphatase PhoE